MNGKGLGPAHWFKKSFSKQFLGLTVIADIAINTNGHVCFLPQNLFMFMTKIADVNKSNFKSFGKNCSWLLENLLM